MPKTNMWDKELSSAKKAASHKNGLPGLCVHGMQYVETVFVFFMRSDADTVAGWGALHLM